MSKGEDDLFEVLAEEMPFQFIHSQYSIKIHKKTLFLDYYIPRLKLALEYDGQQHFEFIKFFHRTLQGFTDSKKRDTLKDTWCRENGITLIRIPHDKEVTKELLRRYINQALITDRTVPIYND